tara:strand:- start:124 stop:567 length:444 start_codon:yes stop_codon:yes gene_type:complete
MDNIIRSRTRLAAIQILAQQLVNSESIDSIKSDFDKYYRNTKIDDGLDKIQYNINFLTKLIFFFKGLDYKIIAQEINHIINFKRKFENWDTIIQAIILIAISELRNSKKEKKIIILDDYIEISKFFVNSKETKLINSILDKIVNEEK